MDEKAGMCKQKFKTIGYYETREEGLIALSNYHQNPYDMDCSKTTFEEVFQKRSAIFSKWFDVTASKTESGIRKVPIAEKILPSGCR